MKNLKQIANNEFTEIFGGVSDISYGYNSKTNKWDLPKVEWESGYGRHWSSYESEMARNAALNIHDQERRMWIKNRVRELEREIQRKKAERIANNNTIGNLFPQLAMLAK